MNLLGCVFHFFCLLCGNSFGRFRLAVPAGDNGFCLDALCGEHHLVLGLNVARRVFAVQVVRFAENFKTGFR